MSYCCTKENNGYPDTDGDSISDSKDECPEEAGIERNNGCPKVEYDITDVSFGNNSSTVQKQYYSDYVISLIGHASKTGSPIYNMKLSKKRNRLLKITCAIRESVPTEYLQEV